MTNLLGQSLGRYHILEHASTLLSASASTSSAQASAKAAWQRAAILCLLVRNPIDGL